MTVQTEVVWRSMSRLLVTERVSVNIKHSRDLRSPRDTYLRVVCSAKDAAVLGNAKGFEHIIACIRDEPTSERWRKKKRKEHAYQLL